MSLFQPRLQDGDLLDIDGTRVRLRVNARARRISLRARWPQITAAMLPRKGSKVQPRMPATRLITASELVWRMFAFIGGPYRSNLMPCASGNASE